MVNNAHMIITNWGQNMAWSVSSPQLPGIVAAFDDQPTSTELMTVALDAGLDADGSMDISIQTVYDVDSNQYYVRCRHDFRAKERTRTAAAAAHQLETDPALRSFLRSDRFTETTVVAVLGTDTIRSVIASADPGQPLAIAVRRAESDTMMYATLINGGAEGRQLRDFGLSHASTISQLFDVLDARTECHPERELVAV